MSTVFALIIAVPLFGFFWIGGLVLYKFHFDLWRERVQERREERQMRKERDAAERDGRAEAARAAERNAEAMWGPREIVPPVGRRVRLTIRGQAERPTGVVVSYEGGMKCGMYHRGGELVLDAGGGQQIKVLVTAISEWATAVAAEADYGTGQSDADNPKAPAPKPAPGDNSDAKPSDGGGVRDETQLTGCDWIVQRFAEHEGRAFGPRRADAVAGWDRLRREAHSGRWRPPVREPHGWKPMIKQLLALNLTVAIYGTTPGYRTVESLKMRSGATRDANLDWQRVIDRLHRNGFDLVNTGLRYDLLIAKPQDLPPWC